MANETRIRAELRGAIYQAIHFERIAELERQLAEKNGGRDAG